MQQKPVNSIIANANVIKVNDTGSQIELTFKNSNGEIVNMQDNIDYFYLTPDKSNYYAVTDIAFEGGSVLFRPPPLPKGYYYIEIKDTAGAIYPAERDVVIHMRESFSSGAEAEYVSYREAIIEDVEPIIVQHMTDNVALYKGEKGDTTLAPPKIYSRDEYNTLPDYDSNTLYFISEVTT